MKDSSIRKGKCEQSNWGGVTIVVTTILLGACSSNSDQGGGNGGNTNTQGGSATVSSSQGGSVISQGGTTASGDQSSGGATSVAFAEGGETNSCITLGQTCDASRRCCSPLVCLGTCQNSVSDRAAKRDVAAVDSKRILESLDRLEISTWRYKEEQSGARHIGPMAQDFKAAFQVGAEDKHIYQIDADGVALAAIQALSAEVKQLGRDNEELRKQVRELDGMLRRKSSNGTTCR